MSEYRAIREKVSFLELCKTPDLAAEVSLQPYNAFGVDAVIMFCDILIPAEAMGMTLDFTDKGPQFLDPLRHADTVRALTVPDPTDKMGFVLQLLTQLRQELASDPHTALIGFAGAPWTLASYMIEGGVSKNFAHLNQWLYNDPESLHWLLQKLADTVTAFLKAQIEAGAQVVQLFDTWGGIHNRAIYDEFIHPYQKAVIEAVKPYAPVVLYVKNSMHVLDRMGETGADVISLDWRVGIEQARKQLGNAVALQGNLDPTAMLAKPEVLKPMVATMLNEGGTQGYIANVGHGLIPQTPPDNVRQVVAWVKAFRSDTTGD